MKLKKLKKRVFRLLDLRLSYKNKSDLTDGVQSQAGRVPKPTRNFGQYFNHIRKLGYSPDVIIDVGAARGTHSLHKSFPESYFILIEPLELFIPQLEDLLKNYEGEVHHCALMREPGEMTIAVSDDLYGSSLMHRCGNDSKRELQTVDVTTLDRLLADKKIKGSALLKVDCQGADFDVILGGVKSLGMCDVVILEVSFYKFWGNHHPDAFEIISFMNDHGFVIHDFLDGLFRPYDGSLGQIDIVFVKKEGFFKKSHRWV